MTSLELHSVLLVCCLYVGSCRSGFVQQFIFPNRVPSTAVALTSSKQHQVSTWLQCLHECSVSSDCVAYVVGFNSEKFSCQLYSCGFKSPCEAEKLLLVNSGYFFHQLKQIQTKQEHCKDSITEALSNPTGVALYITGCNKVTIYGDVVQLGRTIGTWQNATKIIIPAGTKVLSLRGECDTNVDCGIKGSLDDGVVTDTSWKCNTEEAAEWMGSLFNDSSWPTAVKHTGMRNSCFGAVSGIDIRASWIWTADSRYDERAHCRLRL